MFSTFPTIIRETASLTRKVSGRGVLSCIRVGDDLPDIEVFEDYPSNKLKITDLTKGKNVVLFAVPGAFCPGCSKSHLPGYLKNADDMKKDGINEIVCMSVNDTYVMSAWGTAHNTKGKIRMLADPSGAFTRALGLGTHMATLGGYRSQRFSMIICNSNVKALNLEPDGTGLTCSLASALKYKQYIGKHEGELS